MFYVQPSHLNISTFSLKYNSDSYSFLEKTKRTFDNVSLNIFADDKDIDIHQETEKCIFYDYWRANRVVRSVVLILSYIAEYYSIPV